LSSPQTNPFKPRKFLKLASRLIDDDHYDEDCRVRTSVGRAYYSVFMYVKCRLELMGGHSFPDNHEVHGAVIEALMTRGHRVIGSQLNTLREKRCDADYHMDVPIHKSQGKYYIQLSERIIDEINHLI
jgi:uncharacterized protein (UPF0332 family)